MRELVPPSSGAAIAEGTDVDVVVGKVVVVDVVVGPIVVV